MLREQLRSKKIKVKNKSLLIFENKQHTSNVDIMLDNSDCVCPLFFAASEIPRGSYSDDARRFRIRSTESEPFLEFFSRIDSIAVGRRLRIPMRASEHAMHKYLIFLCPFYTSPKMESVLRIQTAGEAKSGATGRMLGTGEESEEAMIKGLMSRENTRSQSIEEYIGDNRESAFATGFFHSDGLLLYTRMPAQDFHIESPEKWEFTIFGRSPDDEFVLLEGQRDSRIYFNFAIEDLAARRLGEVYVHVARRPDSSGPFILNISTLKEEFSTKVFRFLRSHWEYVLVLAGVVVVLGVVACVLRRLKARRSARVGCLVKKRECKKWEEEERVRKSSDKGDKNGKDTTKSRDSVDTAELGRRELSRSQMALISDYLAKKITADSALRKEFTSQSERDVLHETGRLTPPKSGSRQHAGSNEGRLGPALADRSTLVKIKKNGKTLNLPFSNERPFEGLRARLEANMRLVKSARRSSDRKELASEDGSIQKWAILNPENREIKNEKGLSESGDWGSQFLNPKKYSLSLKNAKDD